MFDQTFANLATAFSDTHGGPFVDAVATWPGVPTYDAGGSIETPGAAQSYNCKAQFDAPTQQMRASEGFLETDVRILVLAKTIARELDTGAFIEASGVKWALLTCQRDTVVIGYECRGRKIA